MSKNETKASVELSHHWLVRKLVTKMERRGEIFPKCVEMEMKEHS